MDRRPVLILMLVLTLALLPACAWAPAYAPVATAELRVGCVYPGKLGDGGWNGSQAQGLRQALADQGLAEGQLLERWQGDAADSAAFIEELAQEGCQLIFCLDKDMEPAMLATAARYPTTRFCCLGGYLSLASDLPNAHDYFPSLDQAYFAAGAAAARVAASPSLGFVAAWPEPAAIGCLSAFILGAQSVDPAAALAVIYTYSRQDSRAEEAAAQELIDAGAVVLAHYCADSQALGLVAAVNQIPWVGWNSMAKDAEFMLTDISCDWAIYFAYAMGCVLAGEPIAPDWRQGLAEGFVRLSPLNPALADSVDQAFLDDVQERLAAGETAVFQGPLYGSQGSLLLAAGEVYTEPLSAPAWDLAPKGVTVLR